MLIYEIYSNHSDNKTYRCLLRHIFLFCHIRTILGFEYISRVALQIYHRVKCNANHFWIERAEQYRESSDAGWSNEKPWACIVQSIREAEYTFTYILWYPLIIPVAIYLIDIRLDSYFYSVQCLRRTMFTARQTRAARLLPYAVLLRDAL